MKVLHQIRTIVRVLFSARRNRFDMVRAMLRRPQLLASIGAYEVGIMTSARVEPRLKLLAETKAATIVACEYCLDIGAALARFDGVTEEQLASIHRYRTSDAFDDEERLVIEMSEALTRVPATVDDDLRARFDAHFTPAQRAELIATIAWENHRSRLNQGLGVRPSGFNDGGVCALPETLATS